MTPFQIYDNDTLRGFFGGLRVVELAGVLAGPALGLFFAEMGARVTKIENPRTGGDLTRHWKLPSEAPGAPVSAYYCSVNWGKDIRFMDVGDPAQRPALEALLRGADIVVSNFKPDSAEKLRLGYAELRALRPDVILAEIGAFPDGDGRPGFDMVLQAESGFLHMTGEPGRPPVKMPVALIDLLAAHQLKTGVLAALLRRQLDGAGSHVRVNLYDAALASLANQASNWLMAGHLPQPLGTLHPNIAPYGELLACADGGRVVLAVGTDAQYAQLCGAFPEVPGLADPAFAHNGGRLRGRAGLQALLAAASAPLDLPALSARLDAARVPYGVLRDMAEVFAQPSAQRLLLAQSRPDEGDTLRVRSTVFELR